MLVLVQHSGFISIFQWIIHLREISKLHYMQNYQKGQWSGNHWPKGVALLGNKSRTKM